jgi:hypothetical protein
MFEISRNGSACSQKQAVNENEMSVEIMKGEKREVAMVVQHGEGGVNNAHPFRQHPRD